MTCPNCGAQLKLDSNQKEAFCQHCGTKLLVDNEVQHIQYDNAEEAGYKFEKGRQRAQAEARQAMNQNVAPTSSNQNTIKKKRTWLWVLGWIFVFPIPLMILLLRKKNMNPVLKYGIIVAAWIVYLAIGLSGNSEKENTGEVNTTNAVSATSVSSMTQEDDSQTDEAIVIPEENIVEANDEVSAASSEDSKEEIKEEIKIQQDITYVELDDLQQLFCDLSSANTRSEINDIVKEKNYQFIGFRDIITTLHHVMLEWMRLQLVIGHAIEKVLLLIFILCLMDLLKKWVIPLVALLHFSRILS